jgi:peptidyl-prolyl cis-trans isomerase SurA
MTALAKSAEQPLDKMVAIVNDDVISGTELNHAVDTAKVQIAQEHVAAPPANVLQKQVLDQLINKKIQLQIAKQAGIEIKDADVDAAIAHIASQNHLSISSLYEHINQEGMTTSEYRHEIHDQMAMQKLQQQEVASKITISPQEVTNFMHSRTWQTNATKEYHLQDILIPFSDTPSTEEIAKAKKHADMVMAKIKQGQNFDQVALSESSGNQALQGGDLGWRQLPEIPTAFADQVVRMHPNDSAGPIQSPNGFHIIRLVEERALSAKQVATSRKAIESLLLQQKFEEAVQNWVSKLRSQAFVVINT